MSNWTEYDSPDQLPAVVNLSGFPAEALAPAVTAASLHGNYGRLTERAVASWADRKPGRRSTSIINRDRFVDPQNTRDQILTAREALNDDVVGGAADMTESLALSAVSLALPNDPMLETVWNQWAARVNLDGVLRDCWHDLFVDSQVVVASWWDRVEFAPKGTGPAGLRLRRKYDLVVPTHLSTLDSTRVVPVGTGLFGREVLAYVASPSEAQMFDATLTPGATFSGGRWQSASSLRSLLSDDDIVRRLVRRRYRPVGEEAAELQAHGFDTSNLFLLDSRFVWRHTLTKSHLRFPRVRMSSVFQLLDLKSQLRARDRAFTIGATNYLVVITQGDDKKQASQPELDALQAGARKLAQFPVLIGDHRLKVEIVSPPTDNTVDQKQYDTLDSRIAARVFGTFVATGASREQDPLKVGRVVGRGLESRRRMLRRAFESEVLNKIVESNPSLGRSPKLRFSPAQISLSFDAGWASFLLDLRQSKEVSRETILSQFDLDQADEAAMRSREAEEFDDIFGTIVPYGESKGDGEAPLRLERRQGGRSGGGNRNGGGAAPGSGQGEEPRDGRPSEGPVEDGLSDRERLEQFLGEQLRPQLIELAGEMESPLPGRHRLKADVLRAALLDHYAPIDESVEDES